ncbi:MAG: teichoic acid biosynthesis protein [Verrucomicrobia bacterium]|nr:teichoic acid biosynthesis protein [Verrucomicrobiota bacterium]
MAKIFISMSGDGRGHATRVRALTEALRGEHDITLFAPGDAYAFLMPLYASSDVTVREIPALRFTYTADNRVCYRRTAVDAARYLRRLPGLVRWLRDEIEAGQPDLAINDFEPALPRAARAAGLPWISVNHQHFLRTYDLSSLPRSLRWHAGYMAKIVGLYGSGQAETVVSSFYFPPLRKGCEHVTQVGVLLRPEVLEASPSAGGHLVAYFRRFASSGLLAALAATGRSVRVYGLGARPRAGNLTFHTVSSSRFIDDLASCAALICTAGNQLVGEALHLGKPVFALPEPNNHEQAINAHFLGQSGAGDWAEFDAVDHGRLRGFLRRLDDFRAAMPRERINGLPATLAVLRHHLRETAAQPVALNPVAA